MLTASFAMTSSLLPQYSVRIIIGGVFAVMVILLFAAPLHKRLRYTKKTFFGMISAIILSVTIALVATQITLLSRSTNGELTRRTGQLAVFACGQQVPILPDSLLSSAAGIGSYTVTTDGEMQFIGYETASPATLGAFFQALGGSLGANVATVPFGPRTAKKLANTTELLQFTKSNTSRESYLELRSGEACTVAPSMLSVYVFRYDTQGKNYLMNRIVQHPEQYVLSDQEYEERDCIVVTYGDPKESTKYTCNGYPASDSISSSIKELSL